MSNPANNDHRYLKEDMSSPARDAFSITGNDSTDLAKITKALHISGSGDVKLTLMNMAAGSSITITLDTGYHPLRAKRVWATGTTATGITGLL